MGVLTGPGVRVLLVGTGQHTAGSELPDLPMVFATVTDLATTMVECCGVQPGQVHTLVDPAHPLMLGRVLTAAVAAAEDVLVVCYLGHGLLDVRGELYLATQATDHLRDGLGYTALPYATLQAELANSRARSVIVLLDCCFSGRATSSPQPADFGDFAATRSSGGYLLASAAPEELALAPAGERYTAFTGELALAPNPAYQPSAPGRPRPALLRAGLIPALEEQGLPALPGSRDWPRVVLTPGAHPIATLASRLSPLAGDPTGTLGARLAADPAELSAVADAVLSRHARREPATGRLILVVDQFEEVFTLCDDPQERRAFLDALSAAAASTALVVLGLRADFYAQCAAEPPLGC